MGKRVVQNKEVKPYPQPTVTPLSAKEYVLSDWFIYAWCKDGIYYRIVIRSGFIYDGASIPMLAWSILGLHRGGIMLAPSLIHDYIYSKKGQLGSSFGVYRQGNWQTVGVEWTRNQADRLFLRMQREAGIAKWRRRITYYCVKLFGGFYWD